MQKFDLEGMSLDELKALRKDVIKTIDTYEVRKRQAALAELEGKAKEFGFTLSDLLGAKPKRKTSSAPAKYRHPENPELTWTGRGRKPRWLAEAVKAGTPIEKFLIV